jgi:hypothetical protein
MNAAASGRRSDQTPHRVEADKLGLLTIGEHRVRVVYDGWRQRDRTFRYTGPCIVCKRKTWSFDDGENDPRGMLGDHALWITTAEARDGAEVELRTCSICANDYDRYMRALDMAKTGRNLGPYRYTIPSDFTDEPDEGEPVYSVVRYFQSGENSVLVRGLTLEQAQAHCNRDDTRGEGWFDGYRQES